MTGGLAVLSALTHVLIHRSSADNAAAAAVSAKRSAQHNAQCSAQQAVHQRQTAAQLQEVADLDSDNSSSTFIKTFDITAHAQG